MTGYRSDGAVNEGNTSEITATTVQGGHAQDQMPTIRLVPHQDPRAARPSLSFSPCQRTLPHEDCIIRVGRYSERDSMPNPPVNTPSSAPIGFKSKVVSRRHCEFWCSQGQWYIKDVKSSSGTFLNHIRLSQPSLESRPWPINDGDVVQLGIDFRGGEEMIFRCVKIRVECNRAWQKTLNSFNVETYKRLRDLGRTTAKKDSDVASAHSSECSICLMSIAPCQSLFVAPCSHVWHYKCIRPILNDYKTWPQFLCPNCRAVTDLEAEVDDPTQEWLDEDVEEVVHANAIHRTMHDGEQPGFPEPEAAQAGLAVHLLSLRNENHLTRDMTESQNISLDSLPELSSQNTAEPIDSSPPRNGDILNGSSVSPLQYLRPITPTAPLIEDGDLSGSSLRAQTPTAEQLIVEGPMTPTNNAGPFVFDGSAGRAGLRGPMAIHRPASELHITGTSINVSP